MTSRHTHGEDLVVFLRENIKRLFNELVLFTEHEHLVLQLHSCCIRQTTMLKTDTDPMFLKSWCGMIKIMETN